ncbi:MAG: aspartate--ammonia ligase [Gudongella sp.]|nr:aspartate--ammonia ligase [Gudongella sp.]
MMMVNGFTPREAQVGIKRIKDYFERRLAEQLNLTRVSAPLFVRPETGLNDNLSGVEKAVSFTIRKHNLNVEIVQSLAKWKRMALKWYEFEPGEGLYADMNAIRPDEFVDSLHSIYVDQWDWERIILKEERTYDTLVNTVESIYEAFKETEDFINNLYPSRLYKKLPDKITFISSQELEDRYPDVSPRQREHLAAKEHGAIFLTQIGARLKSGEPHDFRSPDYDDWALNGDIIFWNPALEDSIELSSMGIRVDEEALERQLILAGAEDRREMEYHKKLLAGQLPYTVGGGIGQSRICMYFLQAKHIGQVQASIWSDEEIKRCEEEGIFLL